MVITTQKADGEHPSPDGRGEPGRAGIPTGTVTILMTDIEGSTRLWETEPAAMEAALQRHDRLLTGVIGQHGGTVVTSRGEGDSFFALLDHARALGCRWVDIDADGDVMDGLPSPGDNA